MNYSSPKALFYEKTNAPAYQKYIMIYISLDLYAAIYLKHVLNNHPNVSEKTIIPYKPIELEHIKLTYDYFYSFIKEYVAPVLQGIYGVFCSNDLLANALWDGLLHLVEGDTTRMQDSESTQNKNRVPSV